MSFTSLIRIIVGAVVFQSLAAAGQLWCVVNYRINPISGTFLTVLNQTDGGGEILHGDEDFGSTYRDGFVDGLTFDSHGTLYAILSTGKESSLGTIDTETGVASLLPGSKPIRDDSGEDVFFFSMDMACDNIIYSVVEGNPRTLLVLNKTDGTSMQTIRFGGDIPNDEVVYSISFDAEGTLWAATNSSPPVLYTIAIPSGVVTIEGSIGGDFAKDCKLIQLNGVRYTGIPD